MDELRGCYTEWSKSDRESQISYDIAYMWNFRKWYWGIYLQNKLSHRHKKQALGYQVGNAEKDNLGDRDWHIHTIIYKIDK